MAQDQVTAPAKRHRHPVLIHDVGLDPGEGERGGTGLERRDAGERRDQDRARLRLPPGVDNGTASAADVGPVPDPCFRVDRLAHRTQQAKRRQVVPLRVVRTPLHERADRGGRCVEDGRLVLLGDRPEAVLVGLVGRSLVHDPGGVVRERAVDDVGVAGDPADVCGTPVHVVFTDVEDHPVRGRDLGQVATGGVDDPLRLAGGAAGVEEVEHVLGVHLLRLALGRLLRHEIVPPEVAARRERVFALRSADRDDVLDGGAVLHGLVGAGLERDHGAAAPGAVGGDEHLGLRVVDPVLQGLGAEPAEHHAVRGPDPRAREHRNGKLGNHPEIDGHPVPFAHPQRTERVREATGFLVEIPIRDGSGISGLPLPVVGDLVPATVLQVPIQAVHGDVEFPSSEPLDPRGGPLHHGVPRLRPGEGGGLFGPEGLVVGVRALVDRGIRDHGRVPEGLGGLEHPMLGKEGFDVGLDLSHGGSSGSGTSSTAPSYGG